MKNTILIFAAILFFTITLAHSKEAKSFSVLCTPIEKGVRVDFQKEEKNFIESYDKDSSNIFKVSFNLSSNPSVIITVIPTEKAEKEGQEVEEYLAELIHYSEHLIIVKFKLPNGLDKCQMISICLDQNLAYLITTAAYLGHPDGEAVCKTNPDAPEASAYVFPMMARMLK